jgi:hypothetical protein
MVAGTESMSTPSGLQLPSARNYRVRRLFLGSLYHVTSSIVMTVWSERLECGAGMSNARISHFLNDLDMIEGIL